MRLTGWHIDGYGPFKDYALDNLKPGLNVLYGPNEAGKSTLLNFIRSVLFGYPAKSQGGPIENFMGGAHGGRLFLEDERGSWSVERMVAKNAKPLLTRPDNTNGDKGALSELLHDFDLKTFRSVFAFDLFDMVQMEGLSDEKIRDKLLTAGVGVHTSAIGKKLEDERAELLKPRSGKLPDLLKAYRDTSIALREAEKRMSEYPSLSAKLLELEAAKEGLIVELKALRLKKGRYETLQKLRPTFLELEKTEGELTRYKALTEDEKKLFDKAAELKVLEDGISGQNLLIEAISDADEELKRREREAAGLLATLGPSWDTSRVKATTIEMATVEKIKDWGARLKNLRDELSRSNGLLDAAKREVLLSGDANPPFETDDPSMALEKLAAISEHLRTRPYAPRSSISPRKKALPLTTALLSAAIVILAWYTPKPLGYAVGGIGLTLAIISLFSLRVREQVEELSEPALEIANSLGLDSVPSFIEISKMEAALRKYDEKLRGLAKAEAAEAEVDNKFGELEAALSLWRNDVERWGFTAAEELSPEGLLNLLREVERTRRALGEVEDAEAKLSSLQKKHREWEENALNLLATLPGYIERRPTGHTLHNEIRHFYRQATEFGETLQKREDAKMQLAKYLTSLKAGFGNAQDYDEGITQLREADPELWKSEVALLSSEEKRLDDELGNAHRECAKIEAEITRLSSTTELAELELERETLRVEGEQLATRWRILTIAKNILRKALDVYLTESQPRVLADASTVFSNITGGRYPAIILPPGEDGEYDLKVVTKSGKHLSGAKELSRGTREELYLSLRLALARDFARRLGPLPFIADDVFVNFDPTRAEASISALSAFSEENQTLLFTCHPETVERIKRTVPQSKMIELPPIHGAL